MSKYLNKKTEVDGIKFDSKKEASYYQIYKKLEKKGKITDLQRQVKYPIRLNHKHVCYYIADFTYKDEKGKLHVIDVKSDYTAKNPTFRLKKKLVENIYEIEIEIVN